MDNRRRARAIINMEIEHAIRYLKSNKAPSPGNVSEMLQALVDNGVDIILNLCKKDMAEQVMLKD